MLILSKDLKFTPRPQRNLPEMDKDIKDFTRELSIAEFFFREPQKWIHLTPLWLKTNPNSVLLKTETVLRNL